MTKNQRIRELVEKIALQSQRERGARHIMDAAERKKRAAKTAHNAELEELRLLVDELAYLENGGQYQPTLWNETPDHADEVEEELTEAEAQENREDLDYIPREARLYRIKTDEVLPYGGGEIPSDCIALGYFDEPGADIDGTLRTGYEEESELAVIAGKYSLILRPISCNDQKWRCWVIVSGPKTLKVAQNRQARIADKGYSDCLDCLLWNLRGVLMQIDEAHPEGNRPGTLERFVAALNAQQEDMATEEDPEDPEETEEDSEDSELTGEE